MVTAAITPCFKLFVRVKSRFREKIRSISLRDFRLFYALILVSTKTYDLNLWGGPTPEVRDSWTSRKIWQIALADNTK